jgi:hypothetical protein
MCEATNGLLITKNLITLFSSRNRKIGCGGKGIPRVDLSAWREWSGSFVENLGK